MNEDKLILTENRLLPRLLDILLTVMAWGGGWIFFYTNFLMQLSMETLPLREAVTTSFYTALVYLLIAVLNGWLLILWHQYNHFCLCSQMRRHHNLISLNHNEFARSLNITPQIISDMSQYNLFTLYHDHIGQIIGLRVGAQDEESRDLLI
ncbi:poly-beta-1,6-N-acetyl-D-glucosamine biosynthesis protein PgaD [Escherichia coli]